MAWSGLVNFPVVVFYSVTYSSVSVNFGVAVLPGPKCSIGSHGFNQVFVPGTTTTSRNFELGIVSDRSYQISAGIQLGIPCRYGPRSVELNSK